MLSPSTPSRAALAAGVPARYVYWSGHSHRRYLFTQTEAAAVAEFEDAVAIAVRDGRVIWAGEARQVPALPASAEVVRAALFVHLLAATLTERRAIIADFRPEQRGRLRLAA